MACIATLRIINATLYADDVLGSIDNWHLASCGCHAVHTGCLVDASRLSGRGGLVRVAELRSGLRRITVRRRMFVSIVEVICVEY